jgi:KDO2-lipid IV(A) lauroyltransferase
MDQGELGYYVYRLAGAVAPRVPPALGYRVAGMLGALAYRLSSLRRNVEDNIAHIIGAPPDSPPVRTIARQVYRNQGKNYYDLLRLAALKPDDISKAVHDLIGLEHLDQALSKGRGVVLVSAHYGNFDLAGQVLALRGYRVTGIAEHLRPERLFQYIRRVRESHGLRYIPIDGSLRSVFRALRANEIVGTAVDRNVTDAGRVVELFGSPARLPDGYLRLALRCHAALVVAFCYRLSDDAFVIEIRPEVELQRSGDMEQDVTASMPRVLSILEEYLSRNPDQWVYFQPVWLPEEPLPGR